MQGQSEARLQVTKISDIKEGQEDETFYYYSFYRNNILRASQVTKLIAVMKMISDVLVTCNLASDWPCTFYCQTVFVYA